MAVFPWASLLRLGAFRAVHGAHPGFPHLGVAVPLSGRPELADVLAQLQDTGLRVTLLCPPSLADTAPDLLFAAARHGHEIAGTGFPDALTHLEVAASQPLRFWQLGGKSLNGKALRRLAQAGVQPLPFALSEPEPGRIVTVPPAGLAERLRDHQARGYQPMPVGTLKNLRSATPLDLLRHLYVRLVEDRFTREHGVIDLTWRADGLLRVAALDHAPAPLPFPRDTPTAELHVHSPRVVGLAARHPLSAYRAHTRSWSDVATALQTRPELAQAEVVFGVTLFYDAMEKAGFTLVELPPLQAHWYALGFRVLRAAYGTTRSSSVPLPRLGWMTRQDFLARHARPSR